MANGLGTRLGCSECTVYSCFFHLLSDERVFTVTYNSSGPEFSRLVQTLTVPINTTRAYVR